MLTRLKCSVCGAEAVAVYWPTMEPLCNEHLREKMLKEVSKELERHNVKSLLVAVSGGKDSKVLLDLLSYTNIKMVAVTIVEGIKDYRVKEASEMKRFASERNIEHLTVTLKEIIGLRVDEWYELKKNLTPCTYCGVARRRALDLLREELGLEKVATGHTLDDEIHTVVINLLRGDWFSILKLKDGRVKPLRKIYERNVAAYALLNNFTFQNEECPYILMKPTLRAKIRQKLYYIEYERPGAFSRLSDWLDTIKVLEKDSNTCEICGFPTSSNRRVCRLCELLLSVGIYPRYRKEVLPRSYKEA